MMSSSALLLSSPVVACGAAGAITHFNVQEFYSALCKCHYNIQELFIRSTSAPQSAQRKRKDRSGKS